MIEGQDRAGAAKSKFSFALQPIIDVDTGMVFAYEAFVRGIHGEPASSVFEHVDHIGKPLFDTMVCERAVGLATRLGLRRHLSLNLFGATSASAPHQANAILRAAGAHAFPAQRIVVELTDIKATQDYRDLGKILKSFRQLGLRTAIDYLSTEQPCLSMLLDCPPAFIKLDRRLCAGIDLKSKERSVVDTLIRLGEQAGITLIADGVETREEFQALCDLGITLFQGYYFAHPEFELLPAVPPDRLVRSTAPSQIN